MFLKIGKLKNIPESWKTKSYTRMENYKYFQEVGKLKNFLKDRFLKNLQEGWKKINSSRRMENCTMFLKDEKLDKVPDGWKSGKSS